MAEFLKIYTKLLKEDFQIVDWLQFITINNFTHKVFQKYLFKIINTVKYLSNASSTVFLILIWIVLFYRLLYF